MAGAFHDNCSDEPVAPEVTTRVGAPGTETVCTVVALETEGALRDRKTTVRDRQVGAMTLRKKFIPAPDHPEATLPSRPL